jgi:CTP synthase
MDLRGSLLFHPEHKSKPIAAHPLFAGFIGTAIERRQQRGERMAELGAAP